jgi:hypothetical protein
VNPFRGLPPDPLHREDAGVRVRRIETVCAALGHVPRPAPQAAPDRSRRPGDKVEETHSEKIVERLARLAAEGR